MPFAPFKSAFRLSSSRRDSFPWKETATALETPVSECPQALLPPPQPSSLPPSYDQCVDEDDHFDLLIRKTLSNRRDSALLRLPDTVLVKVMESAGLTDLLRLRHTSRVFMRLFSQHKSFKRHHLTQADDCERYHDTTRIWAAPRCYFPHQTAHPTLSMCADCSKNRQGDILGRNLLQSMPHLYCSGCKTTHREMHFTEDEQIAEDEERICIGHEGTLQVCKELMITLHQVVARCRRPGRAIACCNRAHGQCQTDKCDMSACPGDCKPTAACYKENNGRLRLQLSFACHIAPVRLSNGKMCPHALRNSLRLAGGHVRLGTCWPRATPGSDSEIRAFDPNVCDCVDWTTRNDVEFLPGHPNIPPAFPSPRLHFPTDGGSRRRWRATRQKQESAQGIAMVIPCDASAVKSMSISSHAMATAAY